MVLASSQIAEINDFLDPLSSGVDSVVQARADAITLGGNGDAVVNDARPRFLRDKIESFLCRGFFQGQPHVEQWNRSRRIFMALCFSRLDSDEG